jgi:FkbM family methyltransferase
LYHEALWHSANDQSTTHALSQDDVSCEWTAFQPLGLPQKTTQMCTYPVATDVYVSGQIKHSGRWHECDALVGFWKEAVEKHTASSLASLPSHKKTPIYLDVDGNIVGSCVMEMLQSRTDAKIVVFEPHPYNLAQITTTIMGQPEHVRKRVAIFPVGVGDVTGNFTMYMSTDNRGHSVVGKKVEAFSGQQFLSAESIFVEKLDDIFNLDEVVIPLLKMDIQGFECKALDGMTSLLSTVDMIFTEADQALLQGQGCTVEGMTSQITNANFSVQNNGNNMIARKNQV